MTSIYKLCVPKDCDGTCLNLTRSDRIRLHVLCLLRDHKYRWHLAGLWRELRRQ